MERLENPRLMEPLLPPEGTRVLEDLAVELASVAAALAGKLSEESVCAVSTLVRSMNCYYSNLIEGHQTHPVEIERALKGDYSSEPHKRDLQLEAFAHIEVQAMIDSQAPSALGVPRAEYILWLHREFCSRLPAELLKSRDPRTGKEEAVVPGEFWMNPLPIIRMRSMKTFIFDESGLSDALSVQPLLVAPGASSSSPSVSGCRSSGRSSATFRAL
jgi:hypothetical protein